MTSSLAEATRRRRSRTGKPGGSARACLLVALALLCTPASAGAAFTAPVSIPLAGNDSPVALAFAGEGSGAVVTQRAGGPGGDMQSVISLPAAKRTTFADSVLLDSARRQDGGVDLLVRHTADLTKRGDIILRRVLTSGRVLDLWSVRTAATRGALARGTDRTIVAWPEGSTLRLMTRPDRGVPSRPRIARVGLKGYIDVDLAIDHRGRPVTAVSQPRGGVVLASLTPHGATVRERQVAAGATGLLEIAVTAAGRVGVLAEDTGIKGDGGECVSDGRGRHIRVVVREPGKARFGAVQTIESPHFGCGSGGALLRALPGDRLTVLYQGGSYDFPPLLARAATAAPGRSFGAPATLARDARADAAVVDASGQLVTALLRRTTQPKLFSGALSILRSAGPEELLAAGPVSTPLLGLDRAGAAVLAWRSGATLQVATDQP
jgi:hypothetical protein